MPVKWASRGVKKATRDQLTDDQWRTVRNPRITSRSRSRPWAAASSTRCWSVQPRWPASWTPRITAIRSCRASVPAPTSWPPRIRCAAGITASRFGAARREPTGEGARHVQGCGRACSRERGQNDDVSPYCDFVIGLANRVARRARRRHARHGRRAVSSGERSFIALLEAATSVTAAERGASGAGYPARFRGRHSPALHPVGLLVLDDHRPGRRRALAGAGSSRACSGRT